MADDIRRIYSILKYCDDIEETINRFGEDEEDFTDDNAYQYTCSFCVAQIGEAIKSLSPELRERYPEVRWKGFSGMRDIITHGYERINLRIVWLTITEDIPELKRICKNILNELNPS